MIEWGIFVLGFAYLSYLIYENYRLKYIRKSFRHIIHVNGTRGKSTVTRMIGAVLRQNNVKVWTKVTGTLPLIIDENGNEMVIKRLGNPTIKEQMRLMKKAYKANIDVLVVECMAISPPYLHMSQHRMLQADIGVMTNVRHDHEEVMGSSIEAIAQTLGLTIPKAGWLFLHEKDYPLFQAKAEALGTKVQRVNTQEQTDYIQENQQLALAVSAFLNVPHTQASLAIEAMVPDIGVFAKYVRNNSTFINGFSINDADSIWMHYKRIVKNYPDETITIILNNRSDRPIRAKQHLHLLKHMESTTVYVAGAYYGWFKLALKQHNVRSIKDFTCKESLIFGIGNFKHAGEEIMNYYMKGD